MDSPYRENGRTPHLVAYALELPADVPRPDLVEQLETSLRTLRRHNGEIPVVLFLYGKRTRDLDALCAGYGVRLHEQGPFERRLASRSPTGWSALARYPLLCKYLNFHELAALGATQVLLCDCDTVFFADVARIFERYSGARSRRPRGGALEPEPLRGGSELHRRGPPRAARRGRRGERRPAVQHSASSSSATGWCAGSPGSSRSWSTTPGGSCSGWR